jgi:RTX calcium-binding nonapeptide repeat (4 copies)
MLEAAYTAPGSDPQPFKVVGYSDDTGTLRPAVQFSIVARGDEGANKFSGIGSGDEVHAGAGKDLVALWGAPALVDGGADTDTVRVKADTSFTAGSLVSVEKVQVENGTTADLSQASNGGNGLTIQSQSTAGGSATGTAYADRFLGAAGAHSVSGGAGRDTLTGNAWRDTFVFDSALTRAQTASPTSLMPMT